MDGTNTETKPFPLLVIKNKMKNREKIRARNLSNNRVYWIKIYKKTPFGIILVDLSSHHKVPNMYLSEASFSKQWKILTPTPKGLDKK